MIYLLTGNKKERKEYVQKLCKQQGIEILSVQNLYFDNFKEIPFENVIPENIGLFGEIECFVAHDCVRDLKIKDILKNYFETEHQLIFSEDSILKKDLTVFQKAGVTIQQFNSEKKIESEKYNTFALADLLGQRDKKSLWMAYRDAISNVSAEEIHGILFWQIKNLALVIKHNLSLDAGRQVQGMNSYVFKKNQSFVKNYSLDEIQELSKKMTEIFHKRDTYNTLEIDLEKLILSL